MAEYTATTKLESLKFSDVEHDYGFDGAPIYARSVEAIFVIEAKSKGVKVAPIVVKLDFILGDGGEETATGAAKQELQYLLQTLATKS